MTWENVTLEAAPRAAFMLRHQKGNDTKMTCYYKINVYIYVYNGTFFLMIHIRFAISKYNTK